jgi:hypothetical protein
MKRYFRLKRCAKCIASWSKDINGKFQSVSERKTAELKGENEAAHEKKTHKDTDNFLLSR